MYNLAWGLSVIFFPTAYFDLVGMDPPAPLAVWRVVGMVLAVYAPAFWWAARGPERDPHIILIAFLGKTLGPIGFVWAWAAGELPAEFGWMLIGNDFVWLPAFALYVRRSAAMRGGWKRFLAGG